MKTALELLDEGWKALVKGLGIADALRYKTLFQPGRGDYASEREQLFGAMTADDWQRELSEWESRSGRSKPDR